MAAKQREATSNTPYAVALSRAAVGALIFSLPLLMTMEMWSLGFEMDSWRLLLLVVANLGLLYGLSRVAGFEASHNAIDDILDAFSAFLVATLTAAILLFLFGAIETSDPLREVVGKIVIQAVPGSFGAMIGAKLMGEGEEIEDDEEGLRQSYLGVLFLMLAGALFLSFSAAPTEEVYLIAYQMNGWQTLALALLSLLLLHLLVYQVGLRGQGRRTLPSGEAIFRFTAPGYAIALCICTLVLWCFGRLDGDFSHAARVIAVLALPASIGAAIGRVVI